MNTDKNQISLRDYFAAAALQGYVAASYKLEHDQDGETEDVGAWPDMQERPGEIEEAASFCFVLADAMLAERAKSEVKS